MIRFQPLFTPISSLLLLSFFFLRNNFLTLPWTSGLKLIRRKMSQLHITSSNYTSLLDHPVSMNDPKFCNGLFAHEGYANHCEYLVAKPQCNTGGLFDYFAFLYCDCSNFNFLGYAVLFLWLAALLYLLGNTAADYFCCSLEKLSSLLNLPSTVAGVSLLPLGNGAPDVFASIAAFMRDDAGNVGLNTVLGGALFVTCIVVGAISLSISDRRVQTEIDRKCFVRDICFFIFTLMSLATILAVGEVTIWGAVAFISIYPVYAFAVAANEVLRKHAQKFKLDVITPLLPERASVFSLLSEEDESMCCSCSVPDSSSESEVPHLENKLPRWVWGTNVAIYSNHSPKDSSEGLKFVSSWNGEEAEDEYSYYSYYRLLSLLEMPLTLPRRLTIPIVDEERWSKSYAVASALLAPIFVTFLWNARYDMTSSSTTLVYVIGIAIGVVLGVVAFLYTTPDQPPQKFVFPWVLGGFVMSIVWFYIIATELVDLLLALGIIFGINPSVLGLTVLAWGNSMGDLMSNVALAMNGKNGLQIAMSGCYAAPMFNTLTGLGIPLLLGAWSNTPGSYIVPKDGTLFYTMGFLFVALMWSLVMVPRNNMCPNKTLGFGLIFIYLVFLSFRVSTSMDVVT